MRAVVQRCSEASVATGGGRVASIGTGFLVLLGIEDGDGTDDLEWLAGKIARLRVFADGAGRMNLSLADLPHAGIIVVSQFTLHASTRRGNRPSFVRAAAPAVSEPLYGKFCERLECELARPVGRGRFGAEMRVALVNDGPVTVIIDSRLRE